MHGPGLIAHQESELIGIWGRDPSKAASVGAELGVPAFADYASLFEAADAIAFAVEPGTQAKLAAEAAAASCHLLLDKPLALDLASAERVVASVDCADVASVIFFTARFNPDLAEFFAEVAGGDWIAADVLSLASIFGEASPYRDSQWRKDRGALWDIGPHALASVTAGLGPVRAVTATPGVGDLVQLVTVHDRAATSSLTLALDVPPAATWRQTVFTGPSGVAVMPESEAPVLECYKRAITDLLECASTQTKRHPLDVRFGRDVVAVLEAADQQLNKAERV